MAQGLTPSVLCRAVPCRAVACHAVPCCVQVVASVKDQLAAARASTEALCLRSGIGADSFCVEGQLAASVVLRHWY